MTYRTSIYVRGYYTETEISPLNSYLCGAYSGLPQLIHIMYVRRYIIICAVCMYTCTYVHTYV